MQRRILLAALLLAPLPAAAQSTPEVQTPWARASAGRAPNGAAYLTLRNPGTAPDRLVAASSPAAGRVELHDHQMDGDVMRMRAIPAIPLPPGGSAVLQPSGMHLMLLDLAAPLREGGSFPLTLRFERAGEVTVMVPVLGPAARGPAGHNH